VSDPATGPGTGAAESLAEGGRWRRFHPATPLVKSWVAVLIGLGIVTDGLIGGGVPGFGPFGGPGGAAGDDLGPDIGLSTQLLGVLALAVVALVGNVVAWWMTAYRVNDGAVQLRSGVLSRSFRQAPLDRIQAVDVVQPIVGRLFGLVELRVEVAGGSESDVRLAYLPEARAQALRNSLLAEAAGMSVVEGEAAPEAPETPILAVPVDRLVASILLTAGGPIVAVVVGLVVLAASDIPLAAAAGVFPALLGLAGFLFSRFARGFNFRLATSEDGIRVRGGLTETRAATIPPGRVQALEFSQPLTWRPRDWWRVRVNVAGYGAGDDSQQRTVLLPVGTRLDALWVLRLVVDDIGTDRPLEVLDAGFTGLGTGGGYVHSPPRARWLDPLSWRRNGYAVTVTAVLIRSGRLQRRLVVVPHERMQSVGLTQGPLERLVGLADVGLHSTPGPVSPVVPHLAPPEAARFVAEQAVRARDARARDRTERWMSRPPVRPDPGPAAPPPTGP
jgi:putative membrane protein